MRPTHIWTAKHHPAHVGWGCAAWAALAMAGLFPGKNATAQTPIVTRNDSFYVPFTVPGNPSGAAERVELFVSGDRGKHWTLYQQRQPREGRFSFRAGVDGEFWFAVRTVFRGGTPDVEQVTRPELIVIVDRQPPKVDLLAKVDGQGQAVAEWSVTDAHLAASGFRLDYQVPGMNEWQPVDLGGQNQLLPNGQLAGQATWWLPNGASHFRLRLQVSDRAGNAVVVARDVSMDPQRRDDELARLPADLPAAAVGSEASEPVGIGRPAVAGVQTQQPHASLTPQPSSASTMLPPSATAAATASDTAEPPPGDSAFAAAERSGAVAPAPPVTSDAALPTSGQTYRTSRARQFQLDYDIESRDRSTVYRVEVWYTADGGRTWRHYGDDTDRQSPALVEVAADGIYGFRLIVQAKEGLVARPPQQGDPADVWIRVDATAPVARFTSAQYGRGTQLGLLHILWEAQDADLSDQPITLLFSADPAGPWRKIVDELPNTGRFDWQPDDRTPERVYLRLEARDRAGNVGVDTLSDPIRSGGLAPQGRIRDVRPLPSP